MNRLEQLDKQVARLGRRTMSLNRSNRKYWVARRIIFVCGALLALVFCNFASSKVAWLVAGLITVLFAVVTYFHTKVRDSITRNSLLIEIKKVQAARIRLDWDLIPGAAHQNPVLSGHPFESDLDVTGPRSLHRLLDSAVTKEGSERLKSWLMFTRPDASLIAYRQRLIKELQHRALFRDKLQLLSAVARISTGPDGYRDASTHWESRMLVDWIERSKAKASLFPVVVVLMSLAVLNIAFVLLWAFERLPRIWPFVFIVYVIAMLSQQAKIAPAFGELNRLEKALRHFSVVFAYLESRSYESTTGLAQVCAPFLDQRNRPSIELKRLGRLAAALGVRTNPILWLLFHVVVPWDFWFSYRLEVIRKEISEVLPRWLDAWYELESLNSLANFAYLNPDYVFPQLTDTEGCFEAESLGHPLLRPEVKVCNDLRLDHEGRIIILTGSNMAGKSTFLRTVGVNLVLAYAGAPVNAASMKTSLFRIFTCIKVSDSVQDGLSYFYAEVKRLQALLAATGEGVDELPVLFLIDEIFRGTNSRERLIGSRSYIHALSQGTSVGLIATHDLDLTKLADEIKGVANYHFREEVKGGRMVFDYHLRTGPCPTTNALKIMRLEGLPVET